MAEDAACGACDVLGAWIVCGPTAKGGMVRSVHCGACGDRTCLVTSLGCEPAGPAHCGAGGAGLALALGAGGDLVVRVSFRV